MKDEQLINEFQYLEDKFNHALTSNNSEEISTYLSSDWVLVEPQFGIITKEQFINAITSGELSHTSMKKEVLRVNLQYDIALVTSRGMNIGIYKGNPFNAEHWVTNIYKNETGNWICIMTQEAPVICEPS